MFYFLVYILNNFFHSVFCLLNCFGWLKKFKIYRNLESVTSTMIHTFPSYRQLQTNSKFQTLLKAIRTLHAENLQKYFKSEKSSFSDLKYFCKFSACKVRIAANILKEDNSIRSQHELFREKSKKRNWPAKYQKINDILYLWYQRCCASNIYPNGQC